jgi:hypothetical protein
MTENEIRAAFAPYKHPYWGVVGRYPAGHQDATTYSCDNYHLLTAIYFRILRSNGFSPNSQEMLSYNSFLEKCRLTQNGLSLFSRFPGRNTDVSEDEIYGMCYLSSSGAEHIHQWGDNKWWVYSINPLGAVTWQTKNYFFGRFPCFTGYLKTATRSFPWLWQLYWLFGFIASALTGITESSGKQESYVQIPIMEKCFLGGLGVRLWKKIMSVRYPGGYKQIATIWAADHPMATFARSDWNE